MFYINIFHLAFIPASTIARHLFSNTKALIIINKISSITVDTVIIIEFFRIVGWTGS